MKFCVTKATNQDWAGISVSGGSHELLKESDLLARQKRYNNLQLTFNTMTSLSDASSSDCNASQFMNHCTTTGKALIWTAVSEKH